MRNRFIAATVVFVSLLAACSDDPVQKATLPDVDVTFAKSTSGACTSGYAQSVETAQVATFAAGATLDSVQALWKKVTADCTLNNATKLARAKEALIEYVRYTIIVYRDQPSDILPTNKSLAITDHWNLVFPYVGYAAPALPSSFDLATSAAKVLTNGELDAAAGDSIEFGIPQLAGLTFKKQVTGGDARGHLFVIYPVSGDCLPDNAAMAESASCFEFASFPAASPTFNPRPKVGICYQHSDNFITPALAHFNGITSSVLQPLVYPSADFCNGVTTPTQYGVRGFLERVGRFASGVFGVKNAYAAHGGLGTIAPGFSPFVPVDRNVLKITFANPAVGETPAEGAIASPDRGSWTKVSATPPGSILVQSSFADISTKPVVLTQAGGNCTNNCGGLDLWSRIATADATNKVTSGKWLITWTAVEDQPAPKDAPFVVRSSDNLEIARVSYSKKSGASVLKYNGAAVSSPIWVRSQAQTFSLVVDLDTKKTTLTITSNPFGANPTSVTLASKGFFDGAAADLSKFQAEFSGIDSGVVGWDNITIERIVDSN